MGLELHKVLVPREDHRLLLRAMYSEDLPLLQYFHQNAGQGLDSCVNETFNQITPNSKFFKIEMPDGTLVGYFVVAEPQEGTDVMEGFFLRKDFRTQEIKDAFIALINSTFSNNFFTSTGANNYRAIQFLLKYNFQIVNPSFDFNNKSFVILEATN
jgi:hypothetical protein